MEHLKDWVGSSLTRNHQSRLERLVRDKHSSLLLQAAKFFYNIVPRSLTAYAEWEESPVLTTLSTPAMPIGDIEFPGDKRITKIS